MLVGTLTVAALVLFRVWGTAVFAVTVAYVLVPLHRRLTDRGLSTWWASAVSAVVGTAAALVPLSIAVFLTYLRRQRILDFVQSLPDSVTIVLPGLTYVVDVESVFRSSEASLSSLALSLASSLPEFGLKATLFLFILFGLLRSHESVENALVTVVPSEHRDVAVALAHRVRVTLYAIYVLQAATAAVTFAFGVVTFWVLGYDIPVTLGFVAGVLQFLPIIGPSILIAALAIYHLVTGSVGAAIAVLVIAGFVVAWLPDVLVRPRLSRVTGNLPGTLYFVGFVGGLLTVGPIGIVVGPLAVGLVAEAMALLAAANAE